MSIIPFRPRRTLSHRTSDKAVKDFERVAKSQGLFIDDKRILDLLNNPNPTGETIEELAKLLGQSE
jgi:hypothetical protein